MAGVFMPNYGVLSPQMAKFVCIWLTKSARLFVYNLIQNLLVGILIAQARFFLIILCGVTKIP